MDGLPLWLTGLGAMMLASWLMVRLLTPSARAVARRRAELRRLASGLGLRYFGTADPAIVELLPSFSLLGEGYAREVANLVAEQRRPPRLLLFDYHTMRSHAQDGDTRPSEYDYSMLHLVAMAAVADGTEVTPMRLFRPDWFGGPVGVSDLYHLTFPGDPGFGSYYLFVGEPREGVRRMFTAPVREAVTNWLQSGPKPVVEIVPGWAITFIETVVTDKDVAKRASALLGYVAGIAKALGDAQPPQGQAPTPATNER